MTSRRGAKSVSRISKGETETETEAARESKTEKMSKATGAGNRGRQELCNGSAFHKVVRSSTWEEDTKS